MISISSLRSLRPSPPKPQQQNPPLPSVLPRRRGRPRIYPQNHPNPPANPNPSSRLSRELANEALVALAVGFPADSLIEEEIHSQVVPRLHPLHQSHYIVVRNHILSLWRHSPVSPITLPQAMESIRSEHRPLVVIAFNFLQDHAFINFGVSPALLNSVPRPPPALPAPTIIIVGAGLAGLAAARQLIQMGFRVLILEGRKRPGGRVFTKKMSSSDSLVIAAADLGGSVLTGINGNPLGVLARQLGFPLHKVRDLCPLYLPDGKPVDSVVDARVETAFNQLLDKVCKLRQSVNEELKCVDCSLGTGLEAFRKVYGFANCREEKMLLDWHLANLEYANAALLSDLSMAFWDQDDPYEMGGDHCFIPGGNSQFVRALVENLPIIYEKTVSRIQYGSDGVLVYTNGQVFRGDMALCTVPLGVLKKGSIEFVPELPTKKQDAIKRLGFGLLNKVAMLFPYDFWGGEIDTFGHLTEETSNRGEFFLFYSYSSVSGGPLLVALVAGEAAIRFEQISPIENIERVMDVLRKIFTPKGIEVPKPLQVVCTRWGSEKFTYGSYSYVAVGSSGDDYDILAESVGNGRVFFAGEATNRRYPATMHGALLSGFREAANIARAARRRSRESAVNNVDQKEDRLDLDILFQTPDLSFGKFSVLYDPSSTGPHSMSLLRVVVSESKISPGSLVLYGLISRSNALQLAEVDEDEKRLGMLYQNFGAKLVGRNALGTGGETLVAQIKAARINNLKKGFTNGNHSS